MEGCIGCCTNCGWLCGTSRSGAANAAAMRPPDSNLRLSLIRPEWNVDPPAMACSPRKNANNFGSEARPATKGGRCRWEVSGLFRRQIAGLLAGLLAAGAGVGWPIGTRVEVLAASPSPPAPSSHIGPTRPARSVDLRTLRASATVAHPGVSLAALPRDRASFAVAKQLANEGKTGRSQGVVSVAGAAPQVAATSAPQIPQHLAGFPVMDLSRQVDLYGSGQDLQPPDTQLAAGSAHLAEADNSVLSIWTKSGTLVTTADLNVFFGLAAGYQASDPRILYDAESSRWFLSVLAFTSTANSQIYIAVSATSDPTASWKVYLLASGTGVIGDQPMTGVNTDKVVISWNDFTGASLTKLTFSGEETWVLQKSDLVSGASLHSSTFGPDLIRFRIVPAQSLAPTATEWLSYDNADCPSNCNSVSPTVGVVAITGTPNGGNVAWTESDPALQATTTPPFPRQPSGVPVVKDNTDSFLSAVWQGGMLWVSGSDGCLPSGDSATRSCLRLVEVSTGGAPTVAQDFDAGQNGVDLYYPAVTLDSSGDLFIGYSQSSHTMYPAASAVDTLANSPTAFENPITLATGLRSYQAGATNRWGDYSGAARDPANPAHVWVTAEYQASASDAGNWGTATGEIAIQPFIATVSPIAGPLGGGQPVTIAGRNFQPGAAVSFGPNPATNVVVVSSTQITATTPSGSALGPVNVIVSQPDSTAFTAPGAYTYTAPPTVTSLVPNHGSPAGGMSVTVTGTSFMAVTAVTFGVAAATTYTVVNATQITATSPAGTGTVDVTVTTASGTSPTSAADQFIFVTGSGVYTALAPHRLLDTRTNHSTLGPGSSVPLAIGGVGSVPANATAVILNVTAVDE